MEKSLVSSVQMRRLPRGWYVFFVIAMMIGMSLVAYADTYNFNFSGKKKGPEGAEPESQMEKAQVAPESSSAPLSQPPVVIHNNVNTPAPAPGTAPSAPAQAAPAETSYARPSASMDVIAPMPSSAPTHPKWKFGFAIGAVRSSAKDAVSDILSDLKSLDEDFGMSRIGTLTALFSAGYRFSRSFGATALVGSRPGRPVFGGELEYFPLQLDVGSFDLLELGVLAGASNMYQYSTFHWGLRMNVNLGPHFSLTTAARSLGGDPMGEVGVAVNL